MALSDVSPVYVEPCISEKRNSTESTWLNASDFGECYPPPSASNLYPRLIPVYNGNILDVPSELVHASLSGISIKHYYGKCHKESEDEEEEENACDDEEQGEAFEFDWFPEKIKSNHNSSLSWKENLSSNSTESGSLNYNENVDEQPQCTIPKINFRNSFWNIHRPELSKLTWSQNYVSAATLTDHLHEHLLQHGPVCVGFHTEEDRNFMLNRELDEYVRLKVLACPRELPPDEPPFNLRDQSKIHKNVPNPRCKTRPLPKVPESNHEENSFPLSDDEEIKGKTVKRSKEEFCLTIGKHIRKPPVASLDTFISEEIITPGLPSAAEEEVSEYFYYNWFLFNGERSFEDVSDKSETPTVSVSETDSGVEPCPPLIMDEFCRAAGKVDFSDIRCNPDF